MTPTRFKAALLTIGWSQRHLASVLECDTNLPTRWARGDTEVPESLARWLSTLAAFVEKQGVPDDWRKR